MMKKCLQCANEYPPNAEYFYRNKQYADGFSYRCKECDNQRVNAYRLTHKKRIAECARLRYQKQKQPRLYTRRDSNQSKNRCACGTPLYWPFEIQNKECMKCRNIRRQTEYKSNPFPIFGKSGRVAQQGSFAKG